MPHDPTLIVEREVELAELQRWWTQAPQGDRQVVFITGEAGIGKTIVVDELVRQGVIRQGAMGWELVGGIDRAVGAMLDGLRQLLNC